MLLLSLHAYIITGSYIIFSVYYLHYEETCKITFSQLVCMCLFVNNSTLFWAGFDEIFIIVWQ